MDPVPTHNPTSVTLAVLLQAIKDGNEVLRADIRDSEQRQETRLTRLEARWEGRFLDHEGRIGGLEREEMRSQGVAAGRSGVLRIGRHLTLDMVAVAAAVVAGISLGVTVLG